MQRNVLISAVIVMWSITATAQTPSPQNAATWYQRAIDQYQAFRNVSPQEWDLLWTYDESTPPTAALRQALVKVQPMIELARRGSTLEYCDFDLDREAGVGMLLPHLNPMRGIGKMMRADAMVRLHDGDTTGAAANIADMYRMSGQFGDDRVLISSLVGHAVFAQADAAVQAALDRGAFGEAESAALVTALNRLGTSDPFAYVEAIIGEQDMIVGSLLNSIGNPDGMADLAQMMDGEVDPENPLLHMDAEQFEREIDLYDDMMSRMVEVFMMPDREAAKADMKAMETEIETMMAQAELGGDGVLAGMMLPALGKILESRDRADKAVADRLALLIPLAAGKVKPDEFANAALWYIRGIGMLEQLDADHLNDVRTFVTDTSAPLADELAAQLAAPAVQDILRVFAEGSTKRRCDFSFARQHRHFDLAPPYAAGMHDAFRLLRADAVRRLRAAEGDQQWEAVDRFATAIRMTGHMAGDPVIVSALISHHNFNTTINLMETGLSNGMLTDEVKPVLLDALERGGRRDPFGYIGAIIATRAELSQRLSQQFWPLNAEADHVKREQLTEAMTSLSGDHALYLLTVINAMQANVETGHADARAQPSNDSSSMYARLADVISIPDIQAAQEDTAVVGPMLAKGSVDVFADRIIPAIAASRLGGTLADHARRARADLRSAFVLLRSSDATDASTDDRE